MLRADKGRRFLQVGATFFAVAALFAMPAFATESANNAKLRQNAARPQATTVTKSPTVAKKPRTATQVRVAYRGMSCVPFARQESGINVAGNAWQWWGNAAGLYQRGATPEPGSVLVFRANGRMRMGHVAVIARVINSREVLIDQANWPVAGSLRGGISQSVPVVDVSERNDWSAVRVGLGDEGRFGSIYPTYGFIYDRPDTGTVEAARHQATEQVAELNPAPRDLRNTSVRPARKAVEVAQAPNRPRRAAAQ